MKQLDQKLEEFVDEIIREIDLKSLIETAVGRGQTECQFHVMTFENSEYSEAVIVNSQNQTMTFYKTYKDAYLAFCKRFEGDLRLVKVGDYGPSLDQYQAWFKLRWD